MSRILPRICASGAGYRSVRRLIGTAPEGKAVSTGFVAFSHPSASRSRAGFTLTEVLVTLGVLTLLLALLFPAFQDTLRSQKSVACMANMKSYGVALNLFIIDNNGLPWWDGSNYQTHQSEKQAAGSTYPVFEPWVRPYLQYKSAISRLRCPLGSKQERQEKGYAYNYAGNMSLCATYPKPQAIPVPPSRVVLAAEGLDSGGFGYAVHLNMTMWGIGEASAGNKTAGVKEFTPIKNSIATRAAQYHGSNGKPGLHLFFLDGHIALVTPPDGNWFNSPVYAKPNESSGFFYDRGHFNALKAGNVYK